MEVAKTLKAALTAINGTLATLREELADTNRQLGSVHGRIAELEGMPVSLEDYCLHLKELIKKQSVGHMKLVEFELFRKGANLPPPSNTLAFSSLPPFLPPHFFGNNDAPTMGALCTFFGDQIYERFLAAAKEQFGERWGNTEYPSVAERRKTVAELEQQAEELKKKRAELEGQIDEITGDLQV